jgi:hypothetical protein
MKEGKEHTSREREREGTFGVWSVFYVEMK